jgi:hypothetical protein
MIKVEGGTSIGASLEWIEGASTALRFGSVENISRSGP